MPFWAEAYPTSRSTFFNVAEVNASVRFLNLAKEALEGGLDEVLRRIVQEVEAASPAIVIVDSFRSVIQAAKRQNGGDHLQHFIQDLGMRLTASVPLGKATDDRDRKRSD
jgi:circadian clock protein KaiC